jgi:hypothetical protein
LKDRGRQLRSRLDTRKNKQERRQGLTLIWESARVQVALEGLDIGLFLLGVHRHRHERAQVAPGLNELQVLVLGTAQLQRRTKDFLSR